LDIVPVGSIPTNNKQNREDPHKAKSYKIQRNLKTKEKITNVSKAFVKNKNF
jgi:hypothetical protein